MKFWLKRTSGGPCPETVEIADLAALVAFFRKHGQLAITNHIDWEREDREGFAGVKTGEPEIEIYDEYRE